MKFAAALIALCLICATLVWIATPSSSPSERVLRVCADPNNLPFSNGRQEGFENRIVGIIAQDLGARLEYVWWAQRRGYIRNTLKAGLCDVIPGLSSDVDMALTTKPYYRSTYVFVARRDSGLKTGSLDAPVLRKVRVGVQIIGDDYTNTPPAHALGRRNIVSNVRGYRVLGDYSEENPPARIIDAVVNGEVDVAIVWGPLAGYFAQRATVPLKIEPVTPQVDSSGLPFVYDISMGVRRGNKELRDELDQAIARNRSKIDAILSEFGVPVI